MNSKISDAVNCNLSGENEKRTEISQSFFLFMLLPAAVVAAVFVPDDLGAEFF